MNCCMVKEVCEIFHADTHTAWQKKKISNINVPYDVKKTKQSEEQYKRKHTRRQNIKFICVVLAVKVTEFLKI